MLGLSLKFLYYIFGKRSNYSAYLLARNSDYILTRDNKKILIPVTIDIVSIKFGTKSGDQILTKSGVELNLKL